MPLETKKTTAVTKIEDAVPIIRTEAYVVIDPIYSSMDAMLAFAERVAVSAFVPSGLARKPAECFIALQAGKEVGLTPMQSLANIAAIGGRATIHSDAVTALIMASGKCEMWSVEYEGTPYQDNLAAVCRTKRRGVDGIVERKFSVADAKLAGLWNKAGTWKQYPKDHLMWKAIARTTRMLFSDVLKGIQVHEDMVDIKPQRPPQGDLGALQEQLAGPVEQKPEEEIQDAEIVEPQPVDADQPFLTTVGGRRISTKLLLPYAQRANMTEQKLMEELAKKRIDVVANGLGVKDVPKLIAAIGELFDKEKK